MDSLKTLQQRRDDLIKEKHQCGQRMAAVDAEIAQIRRAIKERRIAGFNLMDGVDASNAYSCIQAALDLLKRLGTEDVDFDRSEQNIIEALKQWLVNADKARRDGGGAQ